ncbi:MAG: FecCD family ABC transporter permease [Prevotella sp.]
MVMKSYQWALLCFLLLSLFFLNLLTGSVRIPANEVLRIIIGEEGTKESWHFIVLDSRLPQALTAVLCGASLSVSGLLLQAAFRNPLAGPSVFGVSSGAALGVAIVMLVSGGALSIGIFTAFGFIAALIAAFIGAMAVISIIYFFASFVRNAIMLLIIGIMVGYMTSSAIMLLNCMADNASLRSYVTWGMGSFSGVTMDLIPLFSIIVLIGLTLSAIMVKSLNILLLGEQYAENLGIDTQHIFKMILLITGLLTAIATAFCGPVAFIGLAVPHLARLLFKSDDYHILLPATILLGAIVALACNIVCTLPSQGQVIPLNAVTPLIGAPVVIYVILHGNR